MAAGDQWWIAFLRTSVLPAFANATLNLEWVRKAIFPTLSQIGINYRHSSLSRHAGDEDFTVKAGDRMPYLPNVYDRLHAPKFHVLAFGDHREIESQLLDCNSFELTDEAQQIFGTHQPFTILLRPDNHIGFIAAGVTATEVENYIGSKR